MNEYRLTSAPVPFVVFFSVRRVTEYSLINLIKVCCVWQQYMW